MRLPATAPAPPLLLRLLLSIRAVLPRPVLVCLLGDRNRIDASEPPVEIDVGAAPAAERTKFLCHGLAAHWACSGTKPIAVFGHDLHMGARSARSNGADPAETDGIPLARQQGRHFIERKPHYVAVGADDLDNEAPPNPLGGIAASLAAPFARGEIGLDVLLGKPLE